MTLPCRQGRHLRRADRALRRSDPDLASMLSIFARLATAEPIPAQEQLRTRPQLTWGRRVLQRPADAAGFLVVFADGDFVPHRHAAPPPGGLPARTGKPGDAGSQGEPADGSAQVFPEDKYRIVDVLQQRATSSA